MGSEYRQESEDFDLKIDSAVENFFSPYEENAPKMDSSACESEADLFSDEEDALDVDDSPYELESDIASEVENVLDMDADELDIASEDEDAPGFEDPSFEPLFDILSEAENASEANDSPEEHKIGSNHRAAANSTSTIDTRLFNSLTEAILTIDWEINDANVKKTRTILEEILEAFPAIKESRAQKVVDGMLTTLDAIATSPQRVSTSATIQLEKAIPILRGISSGEQMEGGYDELIENVIAGLEACRTEDLPAPAKEEKAYSPNLTLYDGIPFNDKDGSDDTSKAERFEPIAVPAGISHALRHHSEVLSKLIRRAERLTDLYSAAHGSENAQALLQKICGLLDLQAKAIQDAFSLNCAVAVLPVGTINSLSDFLGFQLKAMGVCKRHAGVLENAYKKQPNRKKFWKSIYLLRIAMERQIDELSRAARGDDTLAKKAETSVPEPLSAIIREHLLALEECMEHAGLIAECKDGHDRKKINDAGSLLRKKIACQVDILRRALG